MKTFHLTIARIGEKLFDGEAASAQFPGTEGMFTVLPNHEALVSELKIGEVHLVAGDGQKFHYEAPKGGVVEISNNQATVLI